MRFQVLIALAMASAGAVRVAAAEPAPTVEIYCIDIGKGVGNATLIVSPAGESMLLDAGPPGSEVRVLEVLSLAKIRKLDYLVNTHFCTDHYGATAALARGIPIRYFVDHGPSVEFQRDDDWWRKHRGPWFKPDTAKSHDDLYRTYLAAAATGRRLVAEPGQAIPIAGLEARVVCSAGKILGEPLPGAGQPNPAGADVDQRVDDDAEDSQSIGMLVQFGKFRFVYLGDLTWNLEQKLFYPRNLVGRADAYVITHHAQSLPPSMGDYYFGLSACPKSELHALEPRVAVLSLGAWGHRQGTSAAMDTVRQSPGLEDIWQTSLIRQGGEKDHNSPADFCANLGDNGGPARFIQLSARADGSFTVSNSRNGFHKDYPAHSER
ncbi:MAG TPA: MBL fold metallo-hydrolase [Pirellulales bacterium]|nr:MBL fold metallo-hydrolase [Pirellulales bacterium]